MQRLSWFGIALASREALRKICNHEGASSAPAAASRDNTDNHWRAWTEAASFLITAGIFFQGMNRYFDKIDVQPGARGPLATKLGQSLNIVDFGVFFLEALIISVAALRLTDGHDRFFALTGAVRLDAAATYDLLRLDPGVTVADAVVHPIDARSRRGRPGYHHRFSTLALVCTLKGHWLNRHVFYFGRKASIDRLIPMKY